MSEIKEAVCALIFKNGKILGVSRKYDSTLFGLIGGKVDAGEDRITALYRETLEETGLRITAHNEIYSAVDDDGYLCTTYLCQVDGEVSTSEKGVVKELDWEELFNGPFGNYNKQVYQAITIP